MIMTRRLMQNRPAEIKYTAHLGLQGLQTAEHMGGTIGGRAQAVQRGFLFCAGRPRLQMFAGACTNGSHRWAEVSTKATLLSTAV